MLAAAVHVVFGLVPNLVLVCSTLFSLVLLGFLAVVLKVAQPRCGWEILRGRNPGLLHTGGTAQPLGFGAEGRWPSEMGRVFKGLMRFDSP